MSDEARESDATGASNTARASDTERTGDTERAKDAITAPGSPRRRFWFGLIRMLRPPNVWTAVADSMLM